MVFHLRAITYGIDTILEDDLKSLKAYYGLFLGSGLEGVGRRVK